MREKLSKCIGAVEATTALYRHMGTGITGLGRYEADVAAVQLMEGVLQHVESVAMIARIGVPGSHYVSSKVIMSSVFEIALTIYWLIIEDDWKEREARYLGWIEGEERFQRNLAKELRLIEGNEKSKQFENYADRLETRRKAIMKLLPKDSRIKRPTVQEMIRECNVESGYYIHYRIGSQFTHGGQAICNEIYETQIGPKGNEYHIKNIGYSAWSELFKMASWCIVQPGSIVLHRAGIGPHKIRKLYHAHEHVLEMCTEMRKGRSNIE
jgi:hypothetical protein